MKNLSIEKICPRCGESKLRARDYYTPVAPYCMECEREYHRERYAATRKVQDGVRINPRTGTVMEHRGVITRIHWSGAMIEKMCRLYPWTKNEDLAVEFGVGQRTITRKARELGLSKHPEFMRAATARALESALFINKYIGNKGQYKKGHIPANKRINQQKSETI